MENLILPSDYHKKLIKIPTFRKVKRILLRQSGKIPMASPGDYIIGFTYSDKEFYLVFQRDDFQKRYRRVYLVDKKNPTKSSEWGSLEVFDLDELKRAVRNMR